MDVRKITYAVILASIAILIVYDFYAIIQGGPEATISWVIIDRSYDYPIIPFAAGVLCGHLFWRAKK